MKFIRISILVLLLSLSFFCLSFADSMGTVILNVEAYPEFDRSIMVNLIGKEGDNYLMVAEPVNDWEYDMELPEGSYIVEYVGVDDIKEDAYKLEYEEKISVKSGLATDFKVEISQAKIKTEKGNQEQKIEGRKNLKQIIKGSTPSLIFIGVAALLLGLIKYGKEKKEYGG
ncbi:hypothetical protein [Sinanaerobacter sp. ZZT-01]|uniref:hypothetical protein n=1 Tax=Sinanaerobacter sp. ZZT-01 TaxID=3111540 RepID=UPI002D7A33E7|nr:hypothetical protein [Sinanaerobacter sp. ZZT-01]WRR94237.1 hypothetical protein U5921_03710 [Sinanaerobacter sp. ZZT-01]